MLNENIKNLRKNKGLSQEELAIKLNVVRQTVSKWENGLSVPDSDMLLSLADALDTSVSILLGETVEKTTPEDIRTISEKLEVINLQLAKRHRNHIRAIRGVLISFCVMIMGIFAALWVINGAYLDWNYGDPELAVAGTILHGFEFVFVRVAPIVLLALVIGIGVTWRRR